MPPRFVKTGIPIENEAFQYIQPIKFNNSHNIQSFVSIQWLKLFIAIQRYMINLGF